MPILSPQRETSPPATPFIPTASPVTPLPITPFLGALPKDGRGDGTTDGSLHLRMLPNPVPAIPTLGVNSLQEQELGASEKPLMETGNSDGPTVQPAVFGPQNFPSFPVQSPGAPPPPKFLRGGVLVASHPPSPESRLPKVSSPPGARTRLQSEPPQPPPTRPRPTPLPQSPQQPTRPPATSKIS